MAHQKLSGRTASTIEPEKLSFVWGDDKGGGWLPANVTTLFVGLPGLGKSTIMRRLIADITQDRPMPNGTLCGSPGPVIYIPLEELIAETVIPGLIAAGADMDKVIILNEVERPIEGHPGEKIKDRFRIPTDLGLLKQEVIKAGASTVMIDSLMVAIDENKRIYGTQTASDVFMQVQALAEELGIAIVIINHFNKKGTKGDIMANMQGPKSLPDRMRNCWMLGPDETDASRFILYHVKCNVGAKQPNIVGRHLGTHVEFLTGLTEDATRDQEQAKLSVSRRTILAALQAEPTRAFTPTALGLLCDLSNSNAKQLLRRMTADKQIVCTDRGFYRAVTSVTKRGRKQPTKP